MCVPCACRKKCTTFVFVVVVAAAEVPYGYTWKMVDMIPVVAVVVVNVDTTHGSTTKQQGCDETIDNVNVGNQAGRTKRNANKISRICSSRRTVGPTD